MPEVSTFHLCLNCVIHQPIKFLVCQCHSYHCHSQQKSINRSHHQKKHSVASMCTHQRGVKKKFMQLPDPMVEEQSERSPAALKQYRKRPLVPEVHLFRKMFPVLLQNNQTHLTWAVLHNSPVRSTVISVLKNKYNSQEMQATASKDPGKFYILFYLFSSIHSQKF